MGEGAYAGSCTKSGETCVLCIHAKVEVVQCVCRHVAFAFGGGVVEMLWRVVWDILLCRTRSREMISCWAAPKCSEELCV